MSKKQYLLAIIDGFEQNAKIPQDLQQLFDKARTALQSVSDEEFNIKYNMVETVTAGENTPDFDQNPLYLLNEAFSHMEHIARGDQANETLNSLLNQLRGFLEIPDRYFP